ncbi:MAG: FkbM family methyltransferase [Fischerella sp.]|jgi:FkbM family methyltransferase|uniref:FkbM family methyltransferase n=1 Tax=Fischerella sp. TaxID=1191 RepID=UPI00183504A0|nr:FkbM family methyltransferase [Fischerella sp.]NWF57769.1 FkbM family methyltransferase [Fischerella sp.]
MKKLMSKAAAKLGRKFLSLSQILSQNQTQQTHKEIYLKDWFKDNGDKTLRLDYDDLNDKSIVFDLGGYEGQWSSDIFAKYCCKIHIFEPVENFYQAIKNRFSKNSQIFVHDFGLSNENDEAFISVDGYNSSITRDVSGDVEKIKLRKAVEFLEENSISKIDLMKINIEGAEYDLLEHLIDSGVIKIIKNIQVQFHEFVPDAENRMKEIHHKLSKTHNLKWQYYFVWEGWENKDLCID